MRTYVQKNIMIEPELWQQAKIFAETTKEHNISSVIRKALEKYLSENTESNLAYKMKIAVTEYVSKEEQAELDIILKDVLSKPIEIDEEETVTIEVWTTTSKSLI